MSDTPPPSSSGPPAYAPIPRRSAPFPAWAIVTLIASVAVAATGVGVVLTRDPDKPVNVSPPIGIPSLPPIDLGSPTASPTAGTTSGGLLEAYLPPEVTNCRTVEPGTDIVQLGFPVIEALNCDPPDPPLGGNVAVAFYLYADPATADAAYHTIVEVVGLTPDSGDCAATNGVGPAESTWSGGGGQGRLLCRPLPENGSALFWTSDGFPVLGGIVSRNPVADVYVYWQMLSDYTFHDV